MSQPLVAGREASARAAWREAYDRLHEAAEAAPLGAADLELLAAAAWWTGRFEEALDLRERAHGAFLADGERARAARVALTLASDHLLKGAEAVANGWFCRGERLLEDEPESVEHGYLALARTMFAYDRGDYEKGLEHARRAGDLGRRFGDADLTAFELAFTGRMLILTGEVERGLALIDEATTAAVAGDLGPLTSVDVYCVMIASCQGLGDYRRAGEWTQAANRFCDQLDASGYPGACRVHRAELIRLQGDLDSAEEVARRATEEVRAYNVWTAASGYYELGEIMRRKGDLAAAEEAYAQAKEAGREPQPGLALLRLAQGKVDAASSAVTRALAGAEATFSRLPLLPAQVEIAIAAGDLRTARTAVAELEELTLSVSVGAARTTAFEAAVQAARAQVALAEGDAEVAAACARRAHELWRELGAPYEAARARVLLGRAYRESGDPHGAEEELHAARATLERVGAALDAREVAELLGEVAPARTFMFTDIVDSTPLAEALGDRKWAKLIAWHDRTLRDLIGAHGGEVVKQTGDGFFAAFASPAPAIEAAVAIQRTLDEYDGVAPDVRIGLHAAGALRHGGDDYTGQGVNAAARVGAAAAAGEIVATGESLGSDVSRYPLSPPRTLDLKGVAEPVELVTVEWR